MKAIVRIDDEVIGIEEFVTTLKLTGQFESLIEQLVRDKVTVHAAKKQHIAVSAEEGEISEQEYEDKVEETFRQMGVEPKE